MERKIAIVMTMLAALAWAGAGVGGASGRTTFAAAVILMPVVLIFGSARGPVLRRVALLLGLVTAVTLAAVGWPQTPVPWRVVVLLIGGALLPWILTALGVLREPDEGDSR